MQTFVGTFMEPRWVRILPLTKTMKMKNPILRFVSVILLILVFGCAYSQSKNFGDMVAEGGSKIKVTPDLAQITLTVEKTDSSEKMQSKT